MLLRGFLGTAIVFAGFELVSRSVHGGWPDATFSWMLLVVTGVCAGVPLTLSEPVERWVARRHPRTISLYQLPEPWSRRRLELHYRALQVESLIRLGRLQEARELVDTISRWPPRGYSDQSQILGIATAFATAGDPATAVELLEGLEPKRWKRLLRRELGTLQVESLVHLGRLQEAREFVDTTSRWPPKSFSDQFHILRIASVFVTAGDPATAVELLEGLEPKRWKRLLRRQRNLDLAAALSQLGRSAEAHELFEDAIAGLKLDRQSPRVRALLLNNRAAIVLDLGEDAGEALAWARQAHQLQPEAATIRSTLAAAILAAGGDPEEALTHLTAADRDSATPVAGAWISYHQGRALKRLGRLEEARRAYQRSVAQGDWPGSRRAAKRLADLDRSAPL